MFPVTLISVKNPLKRTFDDLNQAGEEVISYTPEIIYHNYMLGLLSALHGSHYYVRSNREDGLGRSDLVLLPKEAGYHGFIFEFKQVEKPAQLEQAAKDALHQIVDRRYDSTMPEHGVKTGFHVGIAFCGKQFALVHEKKDYLPACPFKQPRLPLVPLKTGANCSLSVNGLIRRHACCSNAPRAVAFL